MARAKSKRRRPELRRLYFSIDRCERSYWFGINHTNRHIWPEQFWEHDSFEVHGPIRHAYDKPIERIRLHVGDEVPADAFYSLAEGVGHGVFKEVSS